MVDGTVRSTTQWNRLTDGTYISHAYVVTPTLHICPGASTTAVRPADVTPAQFLAAAVPGAQQGWREFGVPASVTIAQAILESGWGRSGLASVDRELLRDQVPERRVRQARQRLPRLQHHTSAPRPAPASPPRPAFRTYATMAHSFRDHGNFLRVNSRYKPAFAYTKDANKFIWRCGRPGTPPTRTTTPRSPALMAAYNLYQYDTWK